MVRVLDTTFRFIIPILILISAQDLTASLFAIVPESFNVLDAALLIKIGVSDCSSVGCCSTDRDGQWGITMLDPSETFFASLEELLRNNLDILDAGASKAQ